MLQFDLSKSETFRCLLAYSLIHVTSPALFA